MRTAAAKRQASKTTRRTPTAESTSEHSATGSRAKLRVEVEWANIVNTKGDVYVCGHYIGVLPQNAEWALDCALSGVPSSASRTQITEDTHLVLTDLTRRGAIRGALGDIIFFPWRGKGQVVLAGMGRLGSFKEPQLRTLAGSLVQAVGRLIPNPVICTVLIGAGVGNLKVSESVAGLIWGAATAIKADPALNSVTLRIVEYTLDRAYEIVNCVKQAVTDASKDVGVEIDFADCITTGRQTEIPGEMGRRDMQINEAIYTSARTGQRVVL